MSKETREHLSALVDGEISKETSRFLVRRLGADEELRATWSRYHLVRDCLRHQDGAIAGEDLRSRVSMALENEKAARPARALPARWLKPLAGMAIAASVALMAIVAIGPGIPGAPQAAGDLADESRPESFVSPQSFSPAPRSSQASFSESGASASRRMDSYLVRHYQAAGSTGGKGFVTLVPIVITGSKDSSVSAGKEAEDQPDDERNEESALR